MLILYSLVITHHTYNTFSLAFFKEIFSVSIIKFATISGTFFLQLCPYKRQKIPPKWE